jgi:hypothetical protein
MLVSQSSSSRRYPLIAKDRLHSAASPCRVFKAIRPCPSQPPKPHMRSPISNTLGSRWNHTCHQTHTIVGPANTPPLQTSPRPITTHTQRCRYSLTRRNTFTKHSTTSFDHAAILLHPRFDPASCETHQSRASFNICRCVV